MGNQSMLSVLCMPALGPCNATSNVGHPPTWQGRRTKTNPTWGSRLYNSEMSARAVRVLQTTRVVLVILRANRVMMHSNLL